MSATANDAVHEWGHVVVNRHTLTLPSASTWKLLGQNNNERVNSHCNELWVRPSHWLAKYKYKVTLEANGKDYRIFSPCNKEYETIAVCQSAGKCMLILSLHMVLVKKKTQFGYGPHILAHNGRKEGLRERISRRTRANSVSLDAIGHRSTERD
jgi:hypothetical protein